MNRLTRGTAAAACRLLSVGCTRSEPESSASPGASASTSVPVQPTGVASEPLVFRYESSQLIAAIPARYGGVTLDRSNFPFNPNRTYTPRPDPLAGGSVEPETCRPLVRGEAWPSGQYAGVPSETPSGSGDASLGEPVAGVEPFASALIVELTGAKATSFLEVLPKVGPECAKIRITGGSSVEQASAVERPLPEFGPESRYILRTYPLGGRQWVERILLYRAPNYVTEVRVYGPQNTEAVFLTFARELRDLAEQRLK